MDNLWHPGLVRLDVGDFGQWNFKFKQLRRQKKLVIWAVKQQHISWMSTIRLYATPKVTKYERCNFVIQIHKFTFRINTISMNLLYECVKIVEFNFNSHVFHVMYQETRFLNQDACFLNQEGRRQFLISFVSERDWNRAHRLEFKMASNRFYIPNANEFFEGLLSLLQQCGYCVNVNTD